MAGYGRAMQTLDAGRKTITVPIMASSCMYLSFYVTLRPEYASGK